MKKLVLLLLICQPVLADVRLQPEVFYKRYDESAMSQTGVMYGISGSASYHNRLFAGVDMLYAAGSVDYTSTNSGDMNGISDWMAEGRVLAGYDVGSITPYVGFGYRYLSDDMKGVTTLSKVGCLRESKYSYIPVGMKFGKKVRTTMEYDWLVSGTQISHWGSNPRLQDVTNKQKSGFGFRCSVEYPIYHKSFDVLITPFFRYWNISNSEATRDIYGTTWIEPSNATKEAGVGITLSF